MKTDHVYFLHCNTPIKNEIKVYPQEFKKSIPKTRILNFFKMCADHPQVVPESIIFSLGVVVSQQMMISEQLSVHLQD